jgi:hypothetical protein
MDMNGRRDRRRITLLAVAALLVVAGLLSAISAPGSAPHSNKADAYGGPVQPRPTNPKSVGECNKYWGTGSQNPGAERKECVAIAHRNAGNKKCAKKKGAAKAKCKKAVKKAFAKEKAAAEAQRKAEKACSDKYSAAIQGLDPDDPDYSSKSQAADQAYETCRKKAQGLS